jgi:hypothetical protein
MTTAKKSRSKKAGKSRDGHKSPPSPAASERKRKGKARGRDAAPGSNIPKLGKSEIGGGEERGGQLH